MKFRACGAAGLLCAALLAATLAAARGLSLAVVGAMAITGILTFLSVAMATKIVSGTERLVYYHHEIAVLGANALLLKILHRPLLPYLDVLILGLGLFLAGGRLGCFMAGCCYGRPWSHGIRYRHGHVAAGFPSCYAGIPLFPVQAVESLAAVGIVAAGAWMVMHRPPGFALWWYTTAYGLTRFCVEFLRSDPERPYFRGFSEAQWTSLLLTAAAGATLPGRFGGPLWYAAAAPAMAIAMAIVVLHRGRRRIPTHALLHARHLMEIAQAVSAPAIGEIEIHRTSLGVQLSAGAIAHSEGRLFHCAISARREKITEEWAHALALVISRLKGAPSGARLIRGNQGVFHVVLELPD